MKLLSPSFMLQSLLNIIFTLKIFEQLALALKNRGCPEFIVLNMYFLLSRIFEQLALALKNRVWPGIFRCIEYVLFIIQDFWATRACPKIIQTRGGGRPPRNPASYAYHQRCNIYNRDHQPFWNCKLLLVYRLMWRTTSLIHTSETKILLSLHLIILVLIFVNGKTFIMPILVLEQTRGGPTSSLWATCRPRAQRWWPLLYKLSQRKSWEQNQGTIAQQA